MFLLGEWVVISPSSSALAFPLDLGARPLCRRLRGRGCATAKASRKQSSLSGKESAQGCVPQRLLGRPV